MNVITKPEFFKNGCAAALGTFDGVHLGHCSVISAVVESGYTPVAVVIMQHGRKKRIFSDDLNLKYLESLGIKTAICLDFEDIHDLTPNEYLQMLHERMNVRFFACGDNHRFGKNAAGSYEDIENYCAAHSLGSAEIDAVRMDGVVVSSTSVRNFITHGEMIKARKFMGHDYQIDFEVVHGDSRGAKLGFATINQPYPDGYILPKFGVYATTVTVDGNKYVAVTNVGIRPTFQTVKPVAETHIIGYSGDLYGQKVNVSFKEFMREETKFDTVEQLISAVEKDKQKCIEMLKNRD